jgi:hypothetical protein
MLLSQILLFPIMPNIKTRFFDETWFLQDVSSFFVEFLKELLHNKFNETFITNQKNLENVKFLLSGFGDFFKVLTRNLVI